LFGEISGGRVLDIAAGQGGSAGMMAEKLADYEEIVGVDVSEENIAKAKANNKNERTRFVAMDASDLEFPENCFDTVSVFNSLHHLEKPDRVLSEMLRVLKPEGHLIIGEVFQDQATDYPNSQRHIHHWWAAVDRVNGVSHRETMTRQEVLDMVGRLPLTGVKVADHEEEPPVSRDEHMLRSLHEYYRRCLQRLEGKPAAEALKERGLELLTIIDRDGVRWEKEVVVVAKKSA